MGTVNQKMQKNNKAQALVEFVLLMPIILMVLFVIIDFASIFYDRNHLEGILSDVVSLVEKDKDDTTIKNLIDDPDISFTITHKGNMATIKLKKNVNLITPFSNVFFPSPYVISTERTILYE